MHISFNFVFKFDIISQNIKKVKLMNYSYTHVIRDILDNLQAFSISQKDLKTFFDISEFKSLFGDSFKTKNSEYYVNDCYNVVVEKIIDNIFLLPLEEKIDFFHKEIMSKQNIEYKKLQTLEKIKNLKFNGSISYKENVKQIKNILKEADSISENTVTDNFKDFVKGIKKEEVYSFFF